MKDNVIELARQEMENAVAAFKHELSRVRTGRASTALIEGLHVNYYGAKTPLRQLAGLAAPEPRLLVITPYDKGAAHEIEKAIQASDLGLNPINDGKVIRHSDSRADRGTAQGSGPSRAQDGRGFPRIDPEPSARRQRHAQGFAQGKKAGRGRSPRCGDQGRSSSPSSSSRSSTKCSPPKRRRLWRSKSRRSEPDPRSPALDGLQQLVGHLTPTGRVPRSFA